VGVTVGVKVTVGVAEGSSVGVEVSVGVAVGVNVAGWAASTFPTPQPEIANASTNNPNRIAKPFSMNRFYQKTGSFYIKWLCAV
jgi:hypothetical protein